MYPNYESIQEIERFIHHEILDANLDLDSFKNFVATKSKNGKNLHMWKLDDLRAQLEAYKASQTSQASEMNETLNLTSFNPTDI